MKKILLVLTNQKTLGNIKTGFHFSEFSHAHEFFISHRYSVTVASLLGGDCPITSAHPEDPVNARYYSDPEKMRLVRKTVKLGNLLHHRFNGIYFAGGPGTLIDFPNNKTLEAMVNKTIAAGGIIAAVCHGPAGFVGMKGPGGTYLVKGKRVNCFTKTETKKTPYAQAVPFYLESALIKQGGLFEYSAPRTGHVAVDPPFVTGQNPESVELVVGAMHALMQKAGT